MMFQGGDKKKIRLQPKWLASRIYFVSARSQCEPLAVETLFSVISKADQVKLGLTLHIIQAAPLTSLFLGSWNRPVYSSCAFGEREYNMRFRRKVLPSANKCKVFGLQLNIYQLFSIFLFFIVSQMTHWLQKSAATCERVHWRLPTFLLIAHFVILISEPHHVKPRFSSRQHKKCRGVARKPQYTIISKITQKKNWNL